MPYVTQDRREVLDKNSLPLSAGELNYLITKMCLKFVKTHELNYQVLNDVVGALEGAKLEFYRRMVAPYENTKIRGNGDVYPEEF